MSVAVDTVKSISWFALFKFISQCFSWFVTIVIARLLLPEDYALMTMATIFTGYAALFSELGLGAAIVQKKEMNAHDLSSLFWIGFISSTLFGFACFLLAYPTAHVFSQDRLIPITQTVSLIFFLNGLAIVPANILRKNMQFKSLGMIEMSGVIVSSASMLIIANSGGGVWTFIGGHIIRDAVKALLYFWVVSWRPTLHFNFKEAKQYLKFGLAISFGSSFKYISEKSDRFFAGIFWAPQMLGFYSFALQLSALPHQKISSIVNQVSFSALSKLQNDKIQFNSLYFQLTKVIFAIVIPLYLGGFWVGEELFKIVLGEKWNGAIFFFRALCLVQIFKSLEPINFQIHAAQGRANLFFWLRAGSGILLPITFYFSIRYGGEHGILIPWFTAYLAFQSVLVVVALRFLNITFKAYFVNLLHPVSAAIIMSLSLYACQEFMSSFSGEFLSIVSVLILKIIVGVVAYVGYFLLFDKQLISSIMRIRKM